MHVLSERRHRSPFIKDWWSDMSQLTAVDISDSDRFELAQVLKDESESSSAPRPLEDILEETCDDDFDPMSQRSCYELLAAHIARPIATIVSRNGHSACSNCGMGIPYHVRFVANTLWWRLRSGWTMTTASISSDSDPNDFLRSRRLSSAVNSFSSRSNRAWLISRADTA